MVGVFNQNHNKVDTSYQLIDTKEKTGNILFISSLESFYDIINKAIMELLAPILDGVGKGYELSVPLFEYGKTNNSTLKFSKIEI